jgi:hypothetical protein
MLLILARREGDTGATCTAGKNVKLMIQNITELFEIVRNSGTGVTDYTLSHIRTRSFQNSSTYFIMNITGVTSWADPVNNEV